MITVVKILIKPDRYPKFAEYADRDSAQAKLLYNAAMFRLRQTFTGWDKENRTDHEEEVFAEIAHTQTVYPSFKAKRVLNYNALDKIMRANQNADFYAGMPMQSAQHVVRQAVEAFKDWLKALKTYKKKPSAFTGRPKMPGYKKSDKSTFFITNQDAVLYPVKDGNGSVLPDQMRLKLPGMKKEDQLILHGISNAVKLKQVTIKPLYGCYMIALTVETNANVSVLTGCSEKAGLDLGTDNIAALACTDRTSVVYKGGAVLSENRWFAKKKADAVSAITCGHKHMHAESAYLDRLSLNHEMRTTNFMHQCSRKIVSWCVKHKVSTLVIGRNKQWKQKADMGKVGNQRFVSVPHYQLIQMIEYKAAIAGIRIIEQEESYTSRADISAMDHIPVYGDPKADSPYTFSGRRVQRGLYRTHEGYTINADCNGAANILRKAIPGAWEGINDFRFLGLPEAMSYQQIIGSAA